MSNQDESNMSTTYGTQPGVNNPNIPHHSHPNSNPVTADSDPAPSGGSYGNTHSTSTSGGNPIHPSSTQSTANPLYGKSNAGQVPYETSGGNSSQGYGGGTYENVGADSTSGGGVNEPYETGGANPGAAGVGSGGAYGGAGSGERHAHTSTEPIGGSPPNAVAAGGGGGVTNGGSSVQPSTGSRVKESASGVKGLVAAVHGVGETVRGKFNSAVDEAFHEPTGIAKNEAIANRGAQEVETGKFSHGTKEREGVVPGDKRAI